MLAADDHPIFRGVAYDHLSSLSPREAEWRSAILHGDISAVKSIEPGPGPRPAAGSALDPGLDFVGLLIFVQTSNGTKKIVSHRERRRKA
jgi:hypothetical protein